MNPITLVIDRIEDADCRVDVVLGRRVPGLSRRKARELGLAGRISLDERKAPPSARVRVGQTLRLHLDAAADGAPPPAVVLACTDRFVYACKPSGIHTHRLRPDDPWTLADAVAAKHPECATASIDPREGGAIHRLDRDTSGIVVFARSSAAWNDARIAFADASVAKDYFAWCTAQHERWPTVPVSEDPEVHWHEAPPSQWIDPHELHIRGAQDMPTWLLDAAMGPTPGRKTMSVRPWTQPARSLIRPLAVVHDCDTGGWAFAAAVRLRTGRRHQARVHLAHVGLPVAGDRQYGTAAELPLCLHARRLDLSPVFAGEPDVVAPLPTHIVALVASTGLEFDDFMAR